MTKRDTTSLRLNRETVRELSDDLLSGAVGENAVNLSLAPNCTVSQALSCALTCPPIIYLSLDGPCG
ncbi:MAG TPA: hypothetical protein VG245_01370 [Candidatus Dormibacteraeota bacterium]|jgi:hypothetical protein|nr:hypothetical protein [Candidatus Dormibacteraeota bacterium]